MAAIARAPEILKGLPKDRTDLLRGQTVAPRVHCFLLHPRSEDLSLSHFCLQPQPLPMSD